jgi:UDP-GlcNAc:undecaprenyl-phosphate/decaprenyl-phosphate GlcNAc-1-phosphate transferase
MTTLLVIFLTALGFSLLLTPWVGRLGAKLGAMDMPGPRKVHLTPVPRIGGLAVLLAFLASLWAVKLYGTQITDLIVVDRGMLLQLGGALVVFGCGLWDDFRRVNAWIKLLFQILGATLAFAGGISIGGFVLGEHAVKFGFLSYAVTVFWFVLFINAVNLIDGLDGLASGVVFFASVVIVVITVTQGQYLPAVYFAALGGATLGFLRYNFNPASIFLGDAGSYFMGYVIADLSILTSVKSQVGALMLIPVLALGVPVFDTLLSPVRRWVRGRRIFKPDNGHIHHKLLAMGISSRNVVLILYGVTAALCGLAILIINVRNEVVGLIVVVIGGTVVVLMRRAGYMEYLVLDKFYGWFRDLTGEAGLSRERRTFLSLQMEMDKARTLEELCALIGETMKMLKFERVELFLKGKKGDDPPPADGRSPGDDPPPWDGRERRKADNGAASAAPSSAGASPAILSSAAASPVAPSSAEASPAALSPAGASPATECNDLIIERFQTEAGMRWVCTRGRFRRSTDFASNMLFKIELPIDAEGSRLVFMKDLSRTPLEYYTLYRMEHLRRSILANLPRLC